MKKLSGNQGRLKKVKAAEPCKEPPKVKLRDLKQDYDEILCNGW